MLSLLHYFTNDTPRQNILVPFEGACSGGSLGESENKILRPKILTQVVILLTSSYQNMGRKQIQLQEQEQQPQQQQQQQLPSEQYTSVN
jgi:hypothetical protein